MKYLVWSEDLDFGEERPIENIGRYGGYHAVIRWVEDADHWADYPVANGREVIVCMRQLDGPGTHRTHRMRVTGRLGSPTYSAEFVFEDEERKE